jgi:hypothetical protein
MFPLNLAWSFVQPRDPRRAIFCSTQFHARYVFHIRLKIFQPHVLRLSYFPILSASNGAMPSQLIRYGHSVRTSLCLYVLAPLHPPSPPPPPTPPHGRMDGCTNKTPFHPARGAISSFTLPTKGAIFFYPKVHILLPGPISIPPKGRAVFHGISRG